MALPSATDVEYVGTGSSGGTCLGQSATEKISFYNATPVVQPSGAGQDAVATTAATSTSPWGFSTSTQADAVVTLVNKLRSDLTTLGLIKGSA